MQFRSRHQAQPNNGLSIIVSRAELRSPATTPAAFREQLDGSDKRVPYLNIYECDPFGTSSLNDNIIKTQILIIMQGGLSERFLR